MPFVGMLRDKSIVSGTGASQSLLPLNGNRQFLLIQNVSGVPWGINPSGVGAAGGTAAIGGTGTITLAPNEKWPPAGLDWVPQNAINGIGTGALTVLEG